MKNKLLAILVLVIASGAPIANAIPIFSTLGPGDSYSHTVGYTIGTGDNFDQGNQFQITVGTPCYLDSIEVAIGLAGGTNQVDVWLMTDAAGLPGTIIETFNFIDAMGPFADSPLITGTSVLNPILTPGTKYWLIASAPQEDDTWAAWNLSDPVVTGLRAIKKGTDPWYVNIDETMAAFRVNGSPVIPAPAAILLGGIGVSFVGWMRRRKTI